MLRFLRLFVRRGYPIARAYLWRGATIWFGVRALVALLMAQAGLTPLRLSASGSVAIVALTIALCAVDVVRRRERALLGNLGVSLNALLPLCGLPAVLGEVAIRTMMHL